MLRRIHRCLNNLDGELMLDKTFIEKLFTPMGSDFSGHIETLTELLIQLAVTVI